MMIVSNAGRDAVRQHFMTGNNEARASYNKLAGVVGQLTFLTSVSTHGKCLQVMESYYACFQDLKKSVRDTWDHERLQRIRKHLLDAQSHLDDVVDDFKAQLGLPEDE